MNDLQIFSNEEFGEVRTITKDGEPWFVAKDISDKLGYAQTSNMMKRIDDEDFISSKLDGMNMNSILINESGLYSAIIGSKLESAKRFKHWVTSEVLPSIRKNGGYIAGQEYLSDDELMAKALLVAQNKIAERDSIIAEKNAQIEQMKPKQIFADSVETSRTSILVGDLAKLICQNGVQIGQKRLFEWMRKNGYLMKYGASRNMPMQKYIEQGLFEIKENSIQSPNGNVRLTITPKVTGKGQVYFINKFLSEGRG